MKFAYSSFILHPRQVGPKGVEPLPSRLKGGSAAVTPRPRVWSGRMRLSRELRCIVVLLVSNKLVWESNPSLHFEGVESSNR
jgi:hypothetical protein